jgi:ferritin heavy chain
MSACNDSLKHGTVWFLFQGAHFSGDTINRPGFAKFFFEAASEEREHAIKIISYLLMRGELTSNIAELIQNPVSNPSSQ